MKLGEVLNDSFDLAKKLTEDMRRLILLIVLGIIPIVNFIVIGYGYRLIQIGKKELPELGNYGELFINGLKIVVALLIYMIIPVALIITGAGIGSLSLAAGIPLVVAGMVIAFLLAIIAAMGIVHMIVNNSFGKAFAFGEIIKVIKRAGTGVYLAWLIIIFVTGVIIGAIGRTPVIGWVIEGILTPFYVVFYSRSALLIYKRGI